MLVQSEEQSQYSECLPAAQTQRSNGKHGVTSQAEREEKQRSLAGLVARCLCPLRLHQRTTIMEQRSCNG
ncbi:hypothetical protein WJX82_009554 [Trebouxia sp. C0006]